MTPEEVLKTGEFDPEFVQLAEQLNLPKPGWDDVAASRDMFDKFIAMGLEAMGPPPPNMVASEQHIPVKDGSKIRVRVIKPKEESGGPLLVMYHGGGFTIGSLEAEEANCRHLVTAFNAVCVSVGYRLAPEFKFPTAVDDAWDALRWAAENAKALGADPSKGFVVGGTSAGGNIAAVMAHWAQDEKLNPPLTGQWLCIPAVLSEPTAAKVLPEKYKKLYLSHEQIVDLPAGLNKKAVDFFMSCYKPDDDDPKFNAFIWPGGQKGLPPAYLQVCGADPIRDEGLLYETLLREEGGVKTKLDLYRGLPHAFWGSFPTHSQSNKYYEDLIQGFSWLLGKEPAKVTVQQVPMAA